MFRNSMVALACVLVALACAAPAPAPPAPPRLEPAQLAERLARVEPGQASAAARAAIGSEPVARPGDTEDPYPSPLRRLRLTTPEGRAVEIDLYVVAVHRAQGCPGAHALLAPVVHADGRVVATGWDFVEAHWRRWGGALDALRAARDASVCRVEAQAP